MPKIPGGADVGGVQNPAFQTACQTRGGKDPLVLPVEDSPGIPVCPAVSPVISGDDPLQAGFLQHAKHGTACFRSAVQGQQDLFPVPDHRTKGLGEEPGLVPAAFIIRFRLRPYRVPDPEAAGADGTCQRSVANPFDFIALVGERAGLADRAARGNKPDSFKRSGAGQIGCRAAGILQPGVQPLKRGPASHSANHERIRFRMFQAPVQRLAFRPGFEIDRLPRLIAVPPGVIGQVGNPDRRGFPRIRFRRCPASSQQKAQGGENTAITRPLFSRGRNRLRFSSTHPCTRCPPRRSA